MTTRSEREKCKKQHEKHLSILMELLREDQNKYCADCRAKGPRWASWNLGIFVCITCAGIHRNLGVHISKVKSVNLDAWTPEQITNMQEWGNRRAAQYYEYHLPSDFKRPQGDSYHSSFWLILQSLEQFIRSKYEKKLYIRKDGPPPASETKQEKVKEKKKSVDIGKKSQQIISRPEVPKSVKSNATTKEKNPVVKPKVSDSEDLLSLSQPAAVPQGNTLLSLSLTKQETDTADLLNFGPSSISVAAAPATVPASQPVMASNSQGFGFNLVQTMSAPVASAPNDVQPVNRPVPTSTQSTLEEDLIKDDLTGAGNQTKDSIMALYKPNQQPSSQQMFGVPGGVYLQPQQQQQQQQHLQQQQQRQPNVVSPQYSAQFNVHQQNQQMQQYQLNQVQQQMAKLGFSQGPQMNTNPVAMQNGQLMGANRAMPTSQVMPGYNAYSQAVPSVTAYHQNTPQVPYTNNPMGPPAGNWMPLKTGTFPPQQQPPAQQAPYLTTGPSGQGFTMYQAQGGMPSGHTLSTNLWK